VGTAYDGFFARKGRAIAFAPPYELDFSGEISAVRKQLCNAAHGTSGPLCRLSNMAERKEQQIQWQAALWAIGRVLSNEFECKEDEVPDRIRQLLAELEAKGKRDNKN
jgi:hypothetical protein